MADVLSQGEIDALMSALSTGEMSADQLKQEEHDKKVRTYDFKRALRFSKDQIRSLSRIHENFARLLTTALSAQLRTFVQISVSTVDQLPYDEFIISIPKMTLLNVFEAQPMEGRLLMEVNPNIAYAMMDRLLGGRGSSVNKIDNLTEIETIIMTRLFQTMLDSFQGAWESVMEIDPVAEEMEVNPQFLQMVSPNETVVVISLSTTIGETTGMINICLPHVVMEEILPDISGHYWMQTAKKETNQDEYLKLSNQIKTAPLNLQAVLGHSSITIEEFLQLYQGDVIELDQKITDPLTILTEGVPKYKAQPGRRGKKLAVQIIEDIKEEKNE